MTENIEKQIQTLKNQLETGDDFNKIIQMFFDLSDNNDFINLGEISKNELLLQILPKILAQVIKDPNPISTHLIHVKKYNMYHGSFIVSQMAGVIIYFESIQMGMVAINKHMIGDTSFIRFTADVMQEGNFPGKSTSFQND